MTQHLSENDIQRFVDHTIGDDELLIIDTHMSECDPCLNKISNRTAVRASVADILANRAGLGDDHLTYEQLEGYVDGGGDMVDIEIADVHMNVCGICSQQLYDLRQIKETLHIETAPLQAPVFPAGSNFTATLWQRITAGSFLRFAGPAFAAILIGAVAWSAWYLTSIPPSEISEVIDPAANKSSDPVITDPANVASSNAEPNTNSAVTTAVISVADGENRLEIDADGNLKGLNAPQFESVVKMAMTTQNIEISPAAKDLRSGSGVLMGDSQPGVSFPLTTPVGRIIETDRPQFKWGRLAGAESYVVTIYDSNFNKIAESPALRQPAWTAGASLKRGAVFQWQVTGVKDGLEIKSPVRPAPDAKFKILDATNANEIKDAKRRNSRLLLGIVYAKAGLLEESEREFQLLRNQNPRSDVARRLLNKVKAAR